MNIVRDKLEMQLEASLEDFRGCMKLLHLIPVIRITVDKDLGQWRRD